MKVSKTMTRSLPFSPLALNRGEEPREKFRAVYDRAFFARHTQSALRSAEIIVPILRPLIRPDSVIDVGCGHGAWLKAFQQQGARELRGLDGDYVDRAQFLVDPGCFTAVDLNQPVKIYQRFDLAICLEVAEHLPESAAAGLVQLLTSVSSFVLFSAAIPGQRGPGHINEQWPSYWKGLFHERGFQRLDPVRRHIWRNDRVQWWYRQNMFLYVARDAIAGSALLQEEERIVELDLIYIEHLARFKTLRGVLRELPRLVKEAVVRRFH